MRRAASRGLGAIGVCGIVVAGLVVIGVIVGTRRHEARAASSTLVPTAIAPAAQGAPFQNHLFSDDESAFVNAEITYLAALNDADTRLATVMAGASTGESTLSSIKAQITETRDVEESAFSTYSAFRVPIPFTVIDNEIADARHLHTAAFRELLLFWTDSNNTHIERGTSTLKRAIVATNQAVTDASAAMTRLASSRRSR